jgi:hypothetical protein
MTDAGGPTSDKKLTPIPRSGQPLSKTGRKYALSAVGFVDTLGAKALSDSEVFMNALAYMVDLQKKISLKPHAATWMVRTTYFSDNIGASVVIEDLAPPEQGKAICKLLQLLGAIQLYYLREFSILCRGGVAIGKCFHDDSVIFGPALVEAYILELTAETPRIVVADSAIKLAANCTVPLHVAEPLRSQQGAPSVSLRSIDFMRAGLPGKQTRIQFVARLETAIKKGMEGLDKNASTAEKWLWTSDKLQALKDSLG